MSVILFENEDPLTLSLSVCVFGGNTAYDKP